MVKQRQTTDKNGGPTAADKRPGDAAFRRPTPREAAPNGTSAGPPPRTAAGPEAASNGTDAGPLPGKASGPEAPPEGTPPPGLDAARHATAQRAAWRGEHLRQAYVPGCLASTLKMAHFDGLACRAYLDQFVKDAGGPTDPVLRVLLEQVAIGHLRLAQLHNDAAHAESAEVIKVFNGAAARLLGEVRRTALALREYRGRAPEESKPRLAQTG